MYDLVIIGGGPAGLSLAHYCRSQKLKILIIERESQIGGCHRVNRVNINDEKVLCFLYPNKWFLCCRYKCL